MNFVPRLVALSFAVIGFTVSGVAQITLTGTSYTQNFNQLASGLPTGWTVSTGATASGLGMDVSANFVTEKITWASATSSGLFRNTSSSNIGTSGDSTAQHANTDRALGWRPDLVGERDGAITVVFANTTGFTHFSVSLDVFTFRDVAAVTNLAFEYRVGTSGSFTQLGSTYTTGAIFGAATYSFSGTALSSVSDQSQPVYFRLRGIGGSGSAPRDGVAIDNFSLSYSVIAAPVPEPAAAGALAGLGAMLACAARRRRRVPAAVKND